MRNLEMSSDREKRSPEDLRRVLSKIYPEETVGYLMIRLGFEDERNGELAKESTP